MSNIGPLGGKGAPLFLYFYSYIVEKIIYEWDVES
jgi:hypothetical protein